GPGAGALGDGAREPDEGAPGRLPEAGGLARVAGRAPLAHHVEHRVAVAVDADLLDRLSVARRFALTPQRPARPAVVMGLARGACLLERRAGGPLEARATLALGFLLLAAHLGGDIAKGARLPRLTGYMLVGFAAGPRWLGLVRGDETVALRFFSDAGLALLALAAGSELRLEALRAGRAALARVATAAVALPFVAVSLVMLSASPWFPLTVHLPLGDRVAVALTLGAFAAASSPAVTMAMRSEEHTFLLQSRMV